MATFTDSRQRIPSHFRSAVGARIRELREQAGLRQRELAALVGVRPDRLAKYEAGDQAPPVLALTRVAQALSLPVDQFLPELQLRSEDDLLLYQQMRRVWAYPPEVRRGVAELILMVCNGLEGLMLTGARAPREVRRAPHR